MHDMHTLYNCTFRSVFPTWNPVWNGAHAQPVIVDECMTGDAQKQKFTSFVKRVCLLKSLCLLFTFFPNAFTSKTFSRQDNDRISYHDSMHAHPVYIFLNDFREKETNNQDKFIGVACN